MTSKFHLPTVPVTPFVHILCGITPWPHLSRIFAKSVNQHISYLTWYLKPCHSGHRHQKPRKHTKWNADNRSWSPKNYQYHSRSLDIKISNLRLKLSLLGIKTPGLRKWMLNFIARLRPHGNDIAKSKFCSNRRSTQDHHRAAGGTLQCYLEDLRLLQQPRSKEITSLGWTTKQIGNKQGDSDNRHY